ncbi:acetaldehyde dehydrogenase (acetylating) [Geosporobacter ferrireducens]|uniref:acetaldehyde dehydrogenase (acetylating) n=1 Tax=Geosporobacter ferrireducens TaxID=1424294 RepID=UPI00139C8316|nr:acetaldehyde dehydrogenase (acetylating) [Geosporobacter ferrireducens]MTI53614.1 acetaldehyde dehydrogenase (acetylating) [Geosporobacter ferrireducens]
MEQLLDRDLQSIQQARNLVSAAKKAQKRLAELEQGDIDRIVKAMAVAAEDASDKLAKMAAEETGFGKYEDKIIKNLFASRAVYEYIRNMKTMGVIREDREEKIVEIGSPVGVIAAMIPSTNPTSTTIYKALIAVKAGNGIIFSPHPAAVKCTLAAAVILHEAAVKAGAPQGLIGCMDLPTMEGSKELMAHQDVALILATGGSALVKAAYSSGTPALGVGPGNVPAFIERSADIPMAVKRVFDSKTFDNGTICASEQAIITESCVENQVREEIIHQGGYFLKGEEIPKVAAVIQKAGGGLNPKIVGQPAKTIAAMACITVPEQTRVLICEQEGVGKAYPFSMEKLSPILAFYVEADWHKACERCIELLNYGGLGHSLVIHSNDEAIIREFALKKPVYRILVNTASSQGAIGATTSLAPSLTLGCGTIGGSATSDNVSPMHLINIKRMVYGIREVEALKPETKKIQGFDLEQITRLVLEQLQKM